MVRIALILMLIALQAVFGIPEFMTDGPELQRAMLYSFFHGNWWHLAINCLAAWSIFAPARKRNWLHLLIGCIISGLVYPLSIRPAIGFSNVLYAVLGLRTPPLKSKWWKQPAVIVFLAVTLALVFVPKFSATTHIAAFLLGMAGAALKRFFNNLNSDYRRYL